MLTFAANGDQVLLDEVPAGESLLTALRDRCGLVGTKNACEQGECGSCLVLLDGAPVCSCLVPVHSVGDRVVTTIEGLSSKDGELNDIQQAFLECGAVQCGFCTPGFVVAVHAFLDSDRSPSLDEVREALAGNLCRCTGYHGIFDAVLLTARRRQELLR